jgi:hypothetical protein
MLSIPIYSKMILGQVLKEPFLVRDKISILVTHDLHIMPIIKFMVPSFNVWLDYLDGVAISLTDDMITVGFAGKIITYPKQALLANT